MESLGKIANTFWLSPEVTGIIELYAQKANISASDAVDQIIIQCSQMIVSGVVEEVTEKDVFEDINRELKNIYGKLDTIEKMNKIIYDELVE